jgi:soluble lytic murein transglycosylase
MRVALLPLILLVFLTSYPANSQTTNLTHSVFTFLDRDNVTDAYNIAKRSGNSVLVKYIYWLYLKDSSTSPSFKEISEFIDKNSHWPDMDRLVLRAEVALLSENPSEDTINQWFAKYPPKTKNGKLFKASHDGSSASSVVRYTWVEGDFSESQENAFFKKYASALRSEDHIERAARLVWDEKYTAAKRMFDLIPASYRQLITARIALKMRARNAAAEASKVQSGLQSDTGLLYDRMVWRHRNDQDDGVRQILLQAPSDVPYPKLWWKLRERHIRESVEEGNYKLARKLLKNHGQTDGPELIDALFLSGWLHLEFEKDADSAYKEFYALYDEAKFPHSKSRAAYWAGRAAEKNGNQDIASGWYRKAGEHPTTYYGQLGLHEMGTNRLSLPSGSKPSSSEINAYRSKELPQLILLLARVGEEERALRFITHLADRAESKSDAALVAQLGKDIGRPDYSVKAAKNALRKGYILTDYAYPKLTISFAPAIEKAVMFALTRQESEFNPRAQSPANAIGMMQLLPSTAKEVARKAKIPYSRNRLYEPQFNMRLGTLYFDRLLKAYDGSYILAAAGYNAGPGRVRQWVKQYGSPGSDYRKAINWIEMIPFEETRNYVQRILENTQVYRHILDEGKLQIAKDLTR